MVVPATKPYFFFKFGARKRRTKHHKTARPKQLQPQAAQQNNQQANKRPQLKHHSQQIPYLHNKQQRIAETAPTPTATTPSTYLLDAQPLLPTPQIISQATKMQQTAYLLGKDECSFSTISIPWILTWVSAATGAVGLAGAVPGSATTIHGD
jgi:hypothetical protein